MKLSRKSILTAIILSAFSTTSWGSFQETTEHDMKVCLAKDAATDSILQGSGTRDEEGVQCYIIQGNDRLGPLLEGEPGTYMAFDTPGGYFPVTDSALPRSWIRDEGTCNNVTIQFDEKGKLLRDKGAPREETPAGLIIDWSATDAYDSLIKLNLDLCVLGINCTVEKNSGNGKMSVVSSRRRLFG